MKDNKYPKNWKSKQTVDTDPL